MLARHARLPALVSFALLAALGAACGAFTGESGGDDAPAPSTTSTDDGGGANDAGGADTGGAVIDGGADAGGPPLAGDAGGDGGDAGPRCDPTKPFEGIQAVLDAPSGMTRFHLTADESHGYYDDGQGKFYRAPMLGFNTLGPPVPVTVDFGTQGSPSSPSLSDDETILFYERDFRVWRATGAAGGPYGGSTQVFSALAGQPWFDVLSQRLYVASYTDAAQFKRDVRYAPSSGASTGATLTSMFFSTFSNHSPTTGPLDQGVFFGLDVSDGASGVEIMQATSGHAAVPVAELNTDNNHNDTPTHLTRDGCIMYFQSNRLTGFGYQLFVAFRPK